MDYKLIDFNNRSQYIHSLNSFISKSKNEINTLLTDLGWCEEFTVNKENLVHCPFEDSHRVPERRLDIHLETCSYRPIGKDSDVTTKPQIPISEQPSSSSAETLALTEFLLPYSTRTEEEKPKTLEAFLKAQRDAKRRKMRYRTSKVHTKNKSHTEIIRGVIDSQMQALEDWIKEEEGIIEENEESCSKADPSSETKAEKSEMFWLDWNFRGNPHTRWKNVIKKEERRKHWRESDEQFSRHNEDDRDKRRTYHRDRSSRRSSYDKHEGSRSKYNDRRDQGYHRHRSRDHTDRERHRDYRHDVENTSRGRDHRGDIEHVSRDRNERQSKHKHHKHKRRREDSTSDEGVHYRKKHSKKKKKKHHKHKHEELKESPT